MGYDISRDTIAAVATPRGVGAVGIVRVSGEQAHRLLDVVFRPVAGGTAAERPRTLARGDVVDGDGAVIDSAMAARFFAPGSFTGEDMAEIHTHGGVYVVQRTLELLLSLGARAAFPGEFTFRAFANGKMDLTQAEAVNDVIAAGNERMLKAALDALKGGLGGEIREIRKRLIDLLARIEVVFEYPDEDVPDVPEDEIEAEILTVMATVRRLTDGYRQAQLLNAGPKIAIAGKPNAGKSSLMNRLLGRERSITHEEPGTTRDLVGDWLAAEGINALIMDTAGITNSSDPVERQGVERTLRFIEDADFALLVLDGSGPLDDRDFEVMHFLREKQKQYSTIINKSDLPVVVDRAVVDREFGAPLFVSALTGEGMEQVSGRVRDITRCMLDSIADVLITNARHKALLDEVIGNLVNALEGMKTNVPQDILTIDIRSAADCLGKITGEVTVDDILQTIFTDFCVGK